MSIIEVTQYMTDDGRTFMTLAEAEDNAEQILIENRINDYLDCMVDVSPLSRVRAGNAIRRFLTWEFHADDQTPDAGN